MGKTYGYASKFFNNPNEVEDEKHWFKPNGIIENKIGYPRDLPGAIQIKALQRFELRFYFAQDQEFCPS